MSSTTKIARQITELLGSIAGISVVSQRINGSSAIFELVSLDATSAQALQEICQGANASLEPPLLLRDPDFNLDKTRSFSLSANMEPVDHVQFGILQFLGIHLVWHLQSQGDLSLQASDEYLQRWHGARVGG